HDRTGRCSRYRNRLKSELVQRFELPEQTQPVEPPPWMVMAASRSYSSGGGRMGFGPFVPRFCRHKDDRQASKAARMEVILGDAGYDATTSSSLFRSLRTADTALRQNYESPSSGQG